MTMNISTKIDHPPCIRARLSLLSSAIVWPSWQSTRLMLMGVPMQLMTAHLCTASHRRWTSPSGQAEQDFTLHCRTMSTENVVGCEEKDCASAPVILAWESHSVL